MPYKQIPLLLALFLVSCPCFLFAFIKISRQDYLRPPKLEKIKLTVISEEDTINYMIKQLENSGKINKGNKKIRELKEGIIQKILYPDVIERAKETEINKLFGKEHLWGLFMFSKRQTNPEILGLEERNYQEWVENRIKKELIAIKKIGSLNLTDEEIISHILNVYEFSLPNGKKLKEVITNNEWARELTTRIINILINGNPDHSFYIAREFNGYGRKLGMMMIEELGKNIIDLKSLMKLSIASGIAGLEVKKKIWITSSSKIDSAAEISLQKDKEMLQNAYSDQICHPFRFKPATHSDETCHPSFLAVNNDFIC